MLKFFSFRSLSHQFGFHSAMVIVMLLPAPARCGMPEDQAGEREDRGQVRHDPTSDRAPNATVTLTARPRKSKYRILEPITVDLEFANNSKSYLTVLSYYDPNSTYSICVYDSAMNVAKETSLRMRYLMGGFSRPGSIPTGKIVRSTVVLNTMYEMLSPGTYYGRVSIEYGMVLSPGDTFIAESETFEIQVEGEPIIDPQPGQSASVDSPDKPG